MQPVYITDITAFLPNLPVDNAQMEQILGMVNKLPSRTRRIILRNNGIKSRYYAIDPATSRSTHTNAQLTAESIRRLSPYEGFTPEDIDCLVCGTSSPDQLTPGHGPMVHGELKNRACEVVSTAGICLCGVTALKYAWMNIACGFSKNAVATGSELTSTFMRAELFAGTDTSVSHDLVKDPSLSFHADFLRWMLSDGAGSAYLTAKKPDDRLSLRIDWLEHVSFANVLDTCMYSGALKNDDGSITGWRECDRNNSEVFRIKQDVKLLNREMPILTIERTLVPVVEKYQLKADDITWFLPHYSSDYFRLPLQKRTAEIGFPVPPERWFTNLTWKGNTGSASIFIILEELFHSGKLKAGDRLLCMIPESGRFSMAYMHLTVV